MFTWCLPQHASFSSSLPKTTNASLHCHLSVRRKSTSLRSLVLSWTLVRVLVRTLAHNTLGQIKIIYLKYYKSILLHIPATFQLKMYFKSHTHLFNCACLTVCHKYPNRTVQVKQVFIYCKGWLLFILPQLPNVWKRNLSTVIRGHILLLWSKALSPPPLQSGSWAGTMISGALIHLMLSIIECSPRAGHTGLFVSVYSNVIETLWAES